MIHTYTARINVCSDFYSQFISHPSTKLYKERSQAHQTAKNGLLSEIGIVLYGHKYNVTYDRITAAGSTEAVKEAQTAAERKLASEREQMQFSLDKALLEADRKHQTEIQALKEEKQQAIDKYQEKCAALLEKLQDRKPEEVTTEK